mmetsp:Transcript_56174/g.156472  ORF Transcript_56174/g.156472 Transcript_56174/m.156472 type:complete len:150 (+) Transcript_56174:13-462(+)
MSLSARFSQLKSAEKLIGRNRVQRNSNSQSTKRSAVTQKRRGAPNNATNNNARRKPNATSKGRGGRGNANVGRKRPGKNTNKKTEKPVKTQEELDKEMDTYWFKAGKAPNPELTSLDKEMDDYFANKNNEASEEAVKESIVEGNGAGDA